MRYHELVEDGRIVQGSNTTQDVGTDEIAVQAKKFGFEVSQDGIPQPKPRKKKQS